MYNEIANEACSGIMPQRLSMLENISNQLDRAQKEVARLTELHKLLSEHPEVNRILELLGSKY